MMDKHPKLELIEALLRKHVSAAEIRAIAWPDSVDELVGMQHYYTNYLVPLGHEKNQPQALFSVIVKRASRLQNAAQGQMGPAPATQ